MFLFRISVINSKSLASLTPGLVSLFHPPAFSSSSEFESLLEADSVGEGGSCFENVFVGRVLCFLFGFGKYMIFLGRCCGILRSDCVGLLSLGFAFHFLFRCLGRYQAAWIFEDRNFCLFQFFEDKISLDLGLWFLCSFYLVVCWNSYFKIILDLILLFEILIIQVYLTWNFTYFAFF